VPHKPAMPPSAQQSTEQPAPPVPHKPAPPPPAQQSAAQPAPTTSAAPVMRKPADPSHAARRSGAGRRGCRPNRKGPPLSERQAGGEVVR
jgi:hypothetical protein